MTMSSTNALFSFGMGSLTLRLRRSVESGTLNGKATRGGTIVTFSAVPGRGGHALGQGGGQDQGEPSSVDGEPAGLPVAVAVGGGSGRGGRDRRDRDTGRGAPLSNTSGVG